MYRKFEDKTIGSVKQFPLKKNEMDTKIDLLPNHFASVSFIKV